MTAATISREEAESKLRALGLNTEPAIQRSLDNPAAEIAALEPWAPHHGARAQKVEILRAYMRGKQTSTEPPDFRAPIDPGVTTSAPFVPTLEQAHHSADCVALYSHGATERQALDFFYRRIEELRAQLIKLAENAPPPALDALAYARGRDDERARCARILQAECDKLVTAGMLRALASIHSGKAAP